MNKRIRWHLPRDIALLELPAEAMIALAQRLNATPRRCLRYRTPAEAFREELQKLETP